MSKGAGLFLFEELAEVLTGEAEGEDFGAADVVINYMRACAEIESLREAAVEMGVSRSGLVDRLRKGDDEADDYRGCLATVVATTRLLIERGRADLMLTRGSTATTCAALWQEVADAAEDRRADLSVVGA